jgi:hypothetical protein
MFLYGNLRDNGWKVEIRGRQKNASKIKEIPGKEQ